MGVRRTLQEKVIFILNPLSFIKMINFCGPWCFRNCLILYFTMKLMRVRSYFSNVGFLLYAN